MFDRLVGPCVRHLKQRLMTFQDAAAETSLPPAAPDKRYLLYLHIPFCVVLCPFCSFHRVEFREDRAARYFEALQREIDHVTAMGYRFGEMYVGGGTPTVMPELLAETISRTSAVHSLSAISVETNPLDLDAAKLEQLQAAGVNRLSVGVQSFDDRLLREMQRLDKYGSGREIVTHLQRVSGAFDTLNVDMIFNFPHQDEKALQADLDVLTGDLGVDQVSWYPLMTSASTERPIAKEMGRVDYSRERRFYTQIVSHMLAAGYERASAWCFSRSPGMFDEYIVEHEEYVGLGSGAFSYLDGGFLANTFSINNYLRRIDDAGSGIVRRRDLTLLEQMRYYLLMQLFSGRLDVDVAERRFDGKFNRMLWRDLTVLRLIGAVTTAGAENRLTESGYYLWVVLMREFFSGVNSFRDDMRHNIPREVAPPPSDFG